MTVVLIDNAEVVVTMDGERREIVGGSLLLRDNVIETVGSGDEVHRALPGGGEPGRIVVERGRFPGLDLDALVHQHNRQAAELLQRAARGSS